VISFHRMILKRAGKHRMPAHFEDLVATGAAALWKAVLNYDAKIGAQFRSYGRKCVIGAIADEARRISR
jgi:DNA-directed RNA polymerase specialized sigma subunit